MYVPKKGQCIVKKIECFDYTLYLWGRQLDKSGARTMGPVEKATGWKALGPTYRHNWENKDLARRVTFPSLAYL